MFRRATCAVIRWAPARSNSSNSSRTIKVTRNPDYWKKDRPYLDGIEYTIIKNVSTEVLAFVSGKFDMTSPYFLQVPVVSDVKNQAPEAICNLVPVNVIAT
jgi:peptide/nickel transport system substrate-binding protein